jgi:hypothetical protein
MFNPMLILIGLVIVIGLVAAIAIFGRYTKK